MRVMVIAPHPDDETLGCGGTLLKHKDKGDNLYWMIVTSANIENGWSEEFCNRREKEIGFVQKEYGFNKTYKLGLPTAKLDTIHISEIITKFSGIFESIKPQILYIPFINDVHTDHQIIGKALGSLIKWFRHPYIEKVLMYETISETDFNFVTDQSFRPNLFINISDYFESKIDIMNIYKDEVGLFPFPRSKKSIESLARMRGSQSGFSLAESFKIIFEKSI